MFLKRRTKLKKYNKFVLNRRTLLYVLAGENVIELRCVLTSFLGKIILSLLIILILTSINVYKNVHLVAYKDLSIIPNYFDDYLLVLNQEEIANDPNLLYTLKEVLIDLALQKYYKNLYVLIDIDHNSDDVNFTELITSNLITDEIRQMFEELQIIIIQNYLSNEICKDIYINIQNNKAIVLGNKDMALPLKIICNNQGMDLEYFEIKQIYKNKLASFENVFYSYIISIFYPIIKL